MGADNGKATATVQQNNLKMNYDFLYRKLDDNYGEVEIYMSKRNPGKRIAIIKKYLKDHLNFKEQIKILAMNYQSNHPNLLEILHFNYSEEQQMCSQYNKINIAIEYHQQNLEQNIIARKEQMKIYSESEIWYIIKCIVDTLTFLQQNLREYKDLHPKNVLITSKGELKLIESIIQDLPVTNYHKVIMGYRNIEYLAPEQLQLIRKTSQKAAVEINQEKVNIFCLGLLCTQCITQTKGEYFYNQDSLTVQYPLLEGQLSNCYEKVNVSENLKKIISQMLNYIPASRPTYQEIIRNINSFYSIKIAVNLVSQENQDIYVNNSQGCDQQENQIVADEEQDDENNIEIPNNEIQKKNEEQFNFLNEEESLHSYKEEQHEVQKIEIIKMNNSQVQSMAKSAIKLIEFEIPQSTIHDKISEIRKNITNRYYTSRRESQKLEIKQKPSPGRFGDTQSHLQITQPDYTNLDDHIKIALLKSQYAQSRCYGIRPEKHYSQQLTPESNQYLSTKGYLTPEDEINKDARHSQYYDRSIVEAIQRTEQAIKQSQLVTNFNSSNY